MNRRHTLFAAVGAAALGLWAVRAYSEQFAADSTPWLSPPDPTQTAGDFAAVSNADATPEQRVAALLALIRKFESHDDYSVLYGGGHFSDYSEHPNVRVPFTNPKSGKQDFSTAAGAYQINFPTWSGEIQPALNLPDFSPESQDMAAEWLIQKIGAYDAAANGDIDTALRLSSKRWASLPYSTAEQNPTTLQTAMDTFESFLPGA